MSIYTFFVLQPYAFLAHNSEYIISQTLSSTPRTIVPSHDLIIKTSLYEGCFLMYNVFNVLRILRTVRRSVIRYIKRSCRSYQRRPKIPRNPSLHHLQEEKGNLIIQFCFSFVRQVQYMNFVTTTTEFIMPQL